VSEWFFWKNDCKESGNESSLINGRKSECWMEIKILFFISFFLKLSENGSYWYCWTENGDLIWRKKRYCGNESERLSPYYDMNETVWQQLCTKSMQTPVNVKANRQNLPRNKWQIEFGEWQSICAECFDKNEHVLQSEKITHHKGKQKKGTEN
jgi:hypothetical protein